MTDKETRRRNYILQGNLWKVILTISAPIALYHGFNFVYGIIDAFLGASISATAVSSIAYLDQIRNTVNTIGLGLATGGSIIVARHLGAGNNERAQKSAGTMMVISMMAAALIIFITVPFAVPILHLTRMPADLIAVGTGYFIVQMITLALVFFNNVFIGLQRAKGSTKSILFYNLAVMLTKITLSLLFIVVLKIQDVMILAIATLIAQGVLTGIGLQHIFNKKYLFRFRLAFLKLEKKTIWPIVALSFPIFLGRFFFSFGKVIVNSVSADYGSQVVGALGVSNQMSGAVTSITGTAEESSSAIISQNLGNRNVKRGLDAFFITSILTFFVAVIGLTLLTIFQRPMAAMFDNERVTYVSEHEKIQITLTFDYEEVLHKFTLSGLDTTVPHSDSYLVDSEFLVGKNLEELYDLMKTPSNNYQEYQIVFISVLDQVIPDYRFSDIILIAFGYEKYAIILFSITTAILGFLYGFGLTKLTMILNILRLFAFRIPTLLLFRYLLTMPEDPLARVEAGGRAVGMAMFVSNAAIGLMAMAVATVVILQVKKKGFKDRLLEDINA